MTASRVAVLDDVERHIKETGGLEGYAQVGTRWTEVDNGLLVISQASDMEQITQTSTTHAANTNERVERAVN